MTSRGGRDHDSCGILATAIAWVLLGLALLLYHSAARAELTGSVTLGKQALEHSPFSRSLSLGYRARISESWIVKPTVGGWLGGPGRESLFVAAPSGVQVVVPSGLYGFASVGPAWISAPDEILGGHWQFMTEFGLGLKNDLKNIEIVWQHFSSAGLVMPNMGRDFIGLQIGF